MSEERNNPPPHEGEAPPQPTRAQDAGSPLPGGASPLKVRTRLPFEQKPGAPHPGFRAASLIYLAACLIMLGVSAFMFFARGFAWTSVPVFAPALAGFYFLVRFMMTARPRIKMD